MPSIPYVDNRRAIQYTGSNSAEIDAEITTFTINSEVGGVLDFDSNGNFAANTGDWIAFTQGAVTGVFAPGAAPGNFEWFYAENALASDLGLVADAAVRSAGVASAPTLLLGVPANVAVQLVPAMPDASYTASAFLFGTGVNLGQVTINSVTVTDADTVTVQVQTSLLSLPGVHILVVAKD